MVTQADRDAVPRVLDSRDEGKERPQQEITAISAALTEDLDWRVGNQPPGSPVAGR